MRQQPPGTSSPQQVADCIHNFHSVIFCRSATSFGLQDVRSNLLTLAGAQITAIGTFVSRWSRTWVPPCYRIYPWSLAPSVSPCTAKTFLTPS